MSESTLILVSPLAGWCCPLAEVPDEVFAQAMAGDGVAIDPTGDVVHAPCDAELVVQGARHVVTLRRGALGIVVHVGVDTVKLDGAGFEMLTPAGSTVRSGEPLLRIDLEHLARNAPSVVTPVIVVSGGRVLRRAAAGRIAVGDFLMEVALEQAETPAAPVREPTQRRELRVPFEHGLHVRPAALVVAALKPFAAEVTLHAHGRQANARSSVAMMALALRCGAAVEARAQGADAAAALDALARVMAAPAAASPASPASAPVAPAPRRIEGTIASRGLAAGRAAPWSTAEIEAREQGDGIPRESEALARAIEVVQLHLEALAREAAGAGQALLAGHAQLVADPELRREATQSLQDGKSAAFAWRAASRSVAAMLEALDDPRMRERAADVRDLENQVLRVLAGKPPGSTREFAPDAIVLADELLPSQMMLLEQQGVAGICIARGGATSHVAILAAASGIPTLVGAGAGILAIAPGTPLLLDAEHGWLDVEPPAAEQARLGRSASARAAERSADLQAASGPALTRDGTRIAVGANLGSFAETAAALRCGAEGCGLLRTEFLFLDRSEAPDEREQRAEYQRIAQALAGRPLTVRTMDVGGDKPIAYLPTAREDNPALGLRGVRASLASPALLRTQLAAIVGVGAPGQCRVMLPMVVEVEEVAAVRRVLEQCAREASAAPVALGVMIETPASALLAEQLAQAADFLSIGTNDLAQYTLAMDRGHPELARRLDALHPAVLRLVAKVVDAGRAHGKPVSVCGALASDVEALPLLIGLGVRELSVAPAMIPRVKRTLRLLELGECAALATRALDQGSAAAVRTLAAEALDRAHAQSPMPAAGDRP